jgi:hypothetical protein
MVIYAGDILSTMQTCRTKGQAIVGPVNVPGTKSFNIIDTNNHDGREHYVTYQEIYEMFCDDKYLTEDEDIEEYKNIKLSRIHIVVAHPSLFPYNDVVRWCFMHIQKETRMIVNVVGAPIVSLREEDLRIRYKTPEPIISLDESFLEKFRIDHKDFETLMEDWFVDEEWLVK